MKNLTYIPFMRNRYFKGKLLTAEDFEQEQQYMNDKRRLMNRWFMGAGIVAGLEVIQVDDYSISLEIGLALDYTGREIVVDAPVIKRLSLLDGYEEAVMEEGDESLYLCIEYAEREVEPVHNITDRSVHTQDEPEYNKRKECYHLYVTDDAPRETEEHDAVLGIGEETEEIFLRAEKIRQTEYHPGIHLAKIGLVKAGEFYMIDHIETVPFHQYVYAQPLVAGWLKKLGRRVREQEKMLEVLEEHCNKEPDHSPENKDFSDWQMAWGMVSVPMPGGGREGRCYYSKEIGHGLGLGTVQIHLEVIQGAYSFSGAEDIFSQEEKPVEAASRLDRARGVFVIGVRALANVKQSEVNVAWTAVRRRSSNEIPKGEARIYIKPALVNLKVHQDIKLEAVCVNMDSPVLEWAVAAPEGGIVDSDGTYHAPGRPGVYEVICRRGDNGPKASVFVIVRE